MFMNQDQFNVGDNKDYLKKQDENYLHQLESSTEKINDKIVGHFNNLTLSSHFQPIISLAHNRVIGYEALLRANNHVGKIVSPMEAFVMASGEEETVFLDRLSRNLHLRNFITFDEQNSWLFLNIDPSVSINGRNHGSYFSDLLQYYNVPAHRVVVEVLESRISDKELLADSVKYYKKMGCLVAIDDFGAGHSNFDRIWSLEPEIVKLDRDIIVQAEKSKKVRRILPSIINLIHESGSMSLIEGVETELQALIAMDSGADFIQGYYFGRPSSSINQNKISDDMVPQLCKRMKNFNSIEENNYHQRLQNNIELFTKSYVQMKNASPIESACKALLIQPHVKRCYLLNNKGKQIGMSLISPFLAKNNDPRFQPLGDAKNAVWARRSYFRNAINNLGSVEISKPYLSIADSKICITVSVSLRIDGEIKVLCCDIDWNED